MKQGNPTKIQTPRHDRLKREVRDLLGSSDLERALDKMRRFPAKKVVNPLFSLLCDVHDPIRWNAITAMGIVVADLAKEDMESARVVIRRLMWNLNDESGGIGWGSAEAMGEILAREKRLGEEYAGILISYIRLDANFQENEWIQRGVLWGIARLARERAELLKEAPPHVIPFLKSTDAAKRGLAARIMGLVKFKGARELLVPLLDDDGEFEVHVGGRPVHRRVREAAAEALSKIASGQD